MHELAVCQGLLRQLEQLAEQHGASGVARIVLSIGPLSGVEPALLRQAFSIARQGTVARDASLEIETSSVVVECRSCGSSSEAASNRLLCGACGDWQVTVRKGSEMLLQQVELSGFKPTLAQPSGPPHQTAR